MPLPQKFRTNIPQSWKKLRNLTSEDILQDIPVARMTTKDGNFFFGTKPYRTTQTRSSLSFALSHHTEEQHAHYPAIPLKKMEKSLGMKITTPELINPRSIRLKNFWISSHVCNTGFHRDGYDNILTVLKGVKHAFLLPPSCTRTLDGRFRPFHTPYDFFGLHTPEDIRTYTRFLPLMRVETITPGECLYIPKGYWHAISTPYPCYALNFWFSRLRGLASIFEPLLP